MLFTEDVATNERNPFEYFKFKNFEMQRSVKKHGCNLLWAVLWFSIPVFVEQVLIP